MRESSKGTSQVQTKSLTWVWILLSVIVVITLITLLTVFYYGETAQDMAESGSSQAEQVSAGTVGSPLDGSGNKISLSSLSCDSLDSVFRDTLDCCGANQGSQRCDGINQAHEKACGNALSCLRVGGRIVALTSESFLGQDVNDDKDELDTTFAVKNLDTGETTYETDIGSDGPFSMDDNVLAYTVSTVDSVTVRDFDAGTTETLPVPGLVRPDSLEGGRIAIRIREDHDSDGLAETGVLVYDMASDQTMYKTFNADMPALAQNFVAYTKKEGEEGVDLDGDGRIAGRVVHYYDFATQTEHNVGISGVRLSADGDRIAFRAGGLKVYNVATETLDFDQQLGFARARPVIDGDFVVRLVTESDEGTDFNNDGDTDDLSFAVVDLTTQTVSKPGKIIDPSNARLHYPRLDNGTVLYLQEGRDLALYDIISEQSQGFNDISAFHSNVMAFDIVR